MHRPGLSPRLVPSKGLLRRDNVRQKASQEPHANKCSTLCHSDSSRSTQEKLQWKKKNNNNSRDCCSSSSSCSCILQKSGICLQVAIIPSLLSRETMNLETQNAQNAIIQNLCSFVPSTQLDKSTMLYTY